MQRPRDRPHSDEFDRRSGADRRDPRTPDLAGMRRNYVAAGLSEDDLARELDDPAAVGGWPTPYGPICRSPTRWCWPPQSADGRPSARTVLLKEYDETGLVFYTNYDSRKGSELTANPRASLVFPWIGLSRQVVLTGDVSVLSREQSARYFSSRPRGSQLGAFASPQSQVIGTRAELGRRVAAGRACPPR
ncbi:MAG: pyridoxal 5'-phosphate synthase [Geodermatophilaceae bacterium]